MRIRNILSLFLLLLLLQRPMPVMGQAIAVAQIQGIISDPSGAAVPNAHITVTQTDINLVRSTVSGSDGAYVFADLPVGSYRLEVGAAGFKKYSQTGIELQVGAKAQINVSLEIGALTQEVKVTANANLVEAQQTGISGRQCSLGGRVDVHRVTPKCSARLRQRIDTRWGGSVASPGGRH